EEDFAAAALAEEVAFRAVESRESRSCCAEPRLPFCRSEPSWFSSLTKELELLEDPAIFESRLEVMPLSEVVADDAVAPLSASCDRVTKSSCAPERLPLLRS